MRNFDPQHLPHLRLPVGPNHVLQVAKEAGVTLSKVLTTHHQWDHAGGNADLWKRYKADPSLGILSIYDGNDDRINNMTNPVGQDDTLENGTVSHNQVYDALITKHSALLDDTKVLCGHDYALINQPFASTFESDNVDITQLLGIAKKADLKRRRAMMPFTIGQLKCTNVSIRLARLLCS
ncbi:hypothetical protein pipiens_016471, partial [Culex pipiens pipiens]